MDFLFVMSVVIPGSGVVIVSAFVRGAMSADIVSATSAIRMVSARMVKEAVPMAARGSRRNEQRRCGSGNKESFEHWITSVVCHVRDSDGDWKPKPYRLPRFRFRGSLQAVGLTRLSGLTRGASFLTRRDRKTSAQTPLRE